VAGRAGKRVSGTEHCFAVEYDVWSRRLSERLLGEVRNAPTCRLGLQAALRELADFFTEQPDVARALFIDVHLVGGTALRKQREQVERFAEELDRARAESRTPHPPPPDTARFMIGAIEAAAVSALLKEDPERFAAAVPELAHLIVEAYFGEQAANEDRAALACEL
jgi:hypothetical protein